jgi:hypothetical protein
VSWPDVRRTLLVAVEQDSDPYAVMIPTAEIITRPRRAWRKHSFGENTVKCSTPSGVASSKKAWSEYIYGDGWKIKMPGR